MTDPDRTDPDRAVYAFRSLLLLTQRLRYLFDRRLDADGLSTSQAMLLTIAQQHAEVAPTYTQLADAMATSHQNVAKLADGLQRRGFVEVRVDLDDRRARRVHVTDVARTYWAGRDDEDFAYVRSLFATLDAEELRTFVALLDRVQQGVRDHYVRTRHEGGSGP